MSHLLIPIDFSETSENAFRYATAFAKKFNASITCLHAYEEDSSDNNVLEQFEVFKADNLLTESSLEIQLEAYPLALDKAFKRCLEAHHFDLILMGTKGAKGFNKLLHASHTTNLLTETQLPFFIIPDNYSFKHFEYILWTSDFKFLEDDNAIDPLVKIAKAFDAEVRIAHVKTSAKHSSYAKYLERNREKYIFASENIKYTFKRIHSDDIGNGIAYYLRLKGDNDLLVLVRRKHSFFDKLFGKDHTMEFAANPKIPLLILHE